MSSGQATGAAAAVRRLPAAGAVSGRWRDRVRAEWLLALLAFVIGCVLIGVDLAWNHGHLIAGQDDVYISFQYAKDTALGHFFAINSGSGGVGGTSTFAYVLWLTLGYLVGFHATALTWFALLTGVLCFAASTLIVCDLGSRLGSRRVGLWAGLLVAVSGSVAWSATSGMEVAPAMLLILATLRSALVEAPTARFRWTPAFAGVLALVRPEGFLFAAALACAQWWYIRVRRGELGRKRARRYAAWVALPILLFVAELVMYRVLTGAFSSTTYRAKSVFYQGPVFFFWPVVDQIFNNVQTLINTYSGLQTQLYAFPGATVAFLGGLGFIFARSREWRPLILAVFAGLCAAFLEIATLSDPFVQYMRYLAPFTPVFVLFCTLGLAALARAARSELGRRRVLDVAAGIALVFALVALPTWIVRFGRATADLRATDVRVAAWVDAHIPKGKIVAVKDLGAVSYYGGHPVVDLIGLGTAGFATPNLQGPGSLYQHLVHLPVASRPAYIVDYGGGVGTTDPFVAVGLLTQPPVATLPVEVQPGPEDPLLTPFTSMVVDRFDWSVAALSAGHPVRGVARDHLTVGYLKSEANHDYSVLPAEAGVQPTTVLARQGDEIDSGRTIVGGEAFTVHGLTPHVPLIITAHWFVQPSTAPLVQVRANGKLADTVRMTATAPNVAWTTSVITVPARLVSGPQVRIALNAPPGTATLNPYPAYTSYGYWFSQPRGHGR